MANIMTVRQFTQNLNNLKPGTQVIVVNGVKRKIVLALQVLDTPEQVEKDIKLIFRR